VIRGRRRGEEWRRLFRGSRLPGTSLHHVEDKVKEVTQVNNEVFEMRGSLLVMERDSRAVARDALQREVVFSFLFLLIKAGAQGDRDQV